MKKSIYKLLTSVSLLGLATSTTLTATPSVFANDMTAQKGTFTVGGSPINVRNDPSTAGEVIDTYQPGQLINYDQIVTANGYRWISYENASGQRRYVAIGTADGTASYGSLSTEGSSSASSQGVPQELTHLIGTWRAANGNWVEFRSDGKVVGNFPGSNYGLLELFYGTPQIWYTDETFYKDRTSAKGSPAIPVGYFAAGEETNAIEAGVDSSQERLLITQYGPVPYEEVYFKDGSGSSSIETKEETILATVDPQMRPSELLAGDFSSVAGEWQMEAGDKLVIDKDGYLGTEKSEEQKLGNISKASETSPDQEEDVILATRGGKTGSAPLIMDYFFFYPAGTAIRMGTAFIPSDESKDRIVVGAKEDAYKNPYYLVKPDETVKDDTTDTTPSSSKEKEETSDMTSSSSDEKEKTTSSSTTKTSTSASSSSKARETTPTETSETKKTTTSSTQQDGNTIQKIYQKVTGRKTLPSTGEAVSVLGLVGAALIGAGLYLARKRKKD